MGDNLYTFSFKDGFKRARKNSGYTQKTFSEKFNISIETVKNWEQGRNIPEIETLERLCNFFHCDLDYLFGNIECETHDKQFIHNYTGLSEDTIDKLSDRISREWVSGALNRLIPMQTFRYALFHIFEYIQELSRLKNIEPDYHAELIISYSDENCGNYLGEGKFEKEYNELENKIEHQEFQINKWFIQTISLIRDNIEKEPNTN